MSGIDELNEFVKATPMFIGPRGGKWQDPQHKIPYKEESRRKKPVREPQTKAPSRHWVKGEDYGLPKETIKAYKKDGEYTAKRKELHNQIVSDFVDHVPTVPKDQKPVAIVMMGGGGSGKGTVVRHVMGDANDFVNVNPDDCKEKLPEYNKALNLGKKDGVTVSAKDAAFMVHYESSEIADIVREKAIAGRKNVLVDGTGKDAEKHKGIISKLKGQGYHVRVMMPHIPLETARERVDSRAEQTGRFVPHEILDKVYNIIPGNFENIARSGDEFALFDNTGKPPPKPVWTYDGKDEKVLDERFVAGFKKMGIDGHKVARANKWMKSMLVVGEQPLRKGDEMKPSVTMDEMLDRMKKDRGEAPDNATMLDDFGDETKVELEKVEKSEDGIGALEEFAKGLGEGSRGGKVIGHTRGGKPIYESDTKPTSTEKPKEKPKLGSGKTKFEKELAQMKEAHLKKWGDVVIDELPPKKKREWESDFRKIKMRQEAIIELIAAGNKAKKSLDPAEQEAIDEEKKEPKEMPLGKGGPFIGPRGGKYADAELTIPWKEFERDWKQAKKEAKGKKERDSRPKRVSKEEFDRLLDEQKKKDNPPTHGGDLKDWAKQAGTLKQKMLAAEEKARSLPKGSSERSAANVDYVMAKEDYDKHQEKRPGNVKKSLDPIAELEEFTKGGPYIGPRGGKWADPQHKIPWDEKPTKKKSKKTETGSKDNPLSKLPGNTDIRDNRGFAFSKWEGKLALVSGPNHYDRNHPGEHNFDPATMSNKYHVRHAIDSRSRQPIPANEKHLGLEPGLSSKKLPYEQLSFRIGGDPWGRTPPEEGRFDSGKEVWVKNKLKDLSPAEKNKVQDHLESKGFKEGVSYNTPQSAQMGAAGWKKAFKQSFTEIQNNSDDYDTVNAVEHFLDHMGVDTTDEKKANKAWAEIPGVFLTDRGGRLKTIVERKPKKGVKKSMSKSEETMSGINELEEFAKGGAAGGLPTGKPTMGGSGPEQGGKLAGVGKTSGTNSSSSGEPINAEKNKKDKLSEDEQEDEKQMKPHKKPIEKKVRKSEVTPQGQRESIAQEHAAAVSKLKKGEDDLEVGVGIAPPKKAPQELEKGREWTQGSESRVIYSDQADKVASELLKSDSFYVNGSPTVGGDPLMGQTVVCPECKETMVKSLTACPTCGYGAVQHKVMPGVAIGEKPLEKSERKAPLLQPKVEKDLVLPNGFKPSDR